MNIKEIYVEAKKSKNFQTYTVGLTAEVYLDLSDDELEIKIAELQTRCRKFCVKQIGVDSK
jgi:hypothetical protein